MNLTLFGIFFNPTVGNHCLSHWVIFSDLLVDHMVRRHATLDQHPRGLRGCRGRLRDGLRRVLPQPLEENLWVAGLVLKIEN